MSDKITLLIVFGICLFLVGTMAGFITWILFAYQKKQVAFQSQLETIKDNYEKELLRAQLEIQEQTFQYISREIHDNVGQYISLAKLNLNVLVLDDKASAAQQVEHSVELLTTALDDLRDLSKSFSADMIKNAGLVKAIELQISQLKKSNNYDIVFEMKGNYAYQQEEKEIILFRIMQEAINNIVRHADAKQICIALTSTENNLEIQIHDNGKGFDISNSLHYSGGINNMRKRSNLIQADFKIESHEQDGTTVIINSPYKTETT